MSGDAVVLLIGAIHLIGLVGVGLLLLPALRDSPHTPKRRFDEGGDDGWGRGPKLPPRPPMPPRGGIPLLDAVQSRVRLREPGRMADRLPHRQRRPAREPSRQPVRTPQRAGSRDSHREPERPFRTGSGSRRR